MGRGTWATGGIELERKRMYESRWYTKRLSNTFNKVISSFVDGRCLLTYIYIYYTTTGDRQVLDEPVRPPGSNTVNSHGSHGSKHTLFCVPGQCVTTPLISGFRSPSASRVPGSCVRREHVRVHALEDVRNITITTYAMIIRWLTIKSVVRYAVIRKS